MRQACERRLAILSELHHGVVGLQQLVDKDVTPLSPRLARARRQPESPLSTHQVKHLLSVGRLERIAYAVYRVVGVPVTWRQALYAATLAAGTWGAASHRSAARVHELPGASESVTEIVCARRHRKGARGAYAHETYLFDECDFTVVDGIPVTTVTRTLCDLGVSVKLGHITLETLVAAIDEGIRRGQTSAEQLGMTWERLGGDFRPGGRHVAEALARFLPQITRSHTSAEATLVRILSEAGYEVVTQHPVEVERGLTLHLDTFIPDLSVAPEFDSYRYHGGRFTMKRDAERTLELAGVRIWRLVVTDEELDNGCPTLLANLAKMAHLETG